MATDIVVWDYETGTWLPPMRLSRGQLPMVGSYVYERSLDGFVRSWDVRAVTGRTVLHVTRSLYFYRQHMLDPDHVAECEKERAIIDALGGDSCPIPLESIYTDLHRKIVALPKG